MPSPPLPEIRRARDGCWYTEVDFETYFQDGGVEWSLAPDLETAMAHAVAARKDAEDAADYAGAEYGDAEYDYADTDYVDADLAVNAALVDSDFLWDAEDDAPPAPPPLVLACTAA